MGNDKRYILTCDDDGHWYVVPVELREVFADWNEGGYLINPNPPEGCRQVPGWCGLVTFADPQCEYWVDDDGE